MLWSAAVLAAACELQSAPVWPECCLHVSEELKKFQCSGCLRGAARRLQWTCGAHLNNKMSGRLWSTYPVFVGLTLRALQLQTLHACIDLQRVSHPTAESPACCAALFVAALVAFPMPELFPRHYWVFHSLWHAFLGAGNVSSCSKGHCHKFAAHSVCRRQGGLPRACHDC